MVLKYKYMTQRDTDTNEKILIIVIHLFISSVPFVDKSKCLSTKLKNSPEHLYFAIIIIIIIMSIVHYALYFTPTRFTIHPIPGCYIRLRHHYLIQMLQRKVQKKSEEQMYSNFRNYAYFAPSPLRLI